MIKLKQLLLVVTLLVSAQSYGTYQNKKSIDETEKIFLTAKVWGFLKYYHPSVASGNYNWDEVFYRWVKEVHMIDSADQLSDYLLDEIKLLGEIEACKKCRKPSKEIYFEKNFDLSWISDSSNFSSDLIEQLLHIEANRFIKDQYYVEPDYAQHVKFINEPDYSGELWVKEEFRLLTLIKFWNAVEYFYPYKYLIDEKWDNVLKEMIPRFMDVTDELKFHLLIRELTIKIDDSHAFFRSPKLKEFFGEKQFPFNYTFVDDQVVITHLLDDSLARINDFQVGDVVLEIDGERVLTKYEQTKKYYNGSNELTKRNYSFVGLLRGHTDQVSMTYERGGVISTKTVNRYSRSEISFNYPEKPLWKKINEHIGYVDVTSLTEKNLDEVMESLFEMKSIIFDVRGYPEFILYELAKYTLNEPVEFFRAIRPDYTYPGKFIWRDTFTIGKRNKNAYSGKVIILINEDTQSLAEFTAMSLQAVENSITVGHQTSAANGDVSTYTFFDECTTWISGLGAYYHNMDQTQRIGLKVDVEVYETLEGIREGRDELLEKAIQVAQKN